MKRVKSILAAAVLGCGLVAGSLAPQLDNQTFAAGQERPTMNIVETAVGPNMERVTTVVAALKAADLIETLQGEGPFTVFAPVNEAFEKLPPGTVDMLLKPENKAKLRSILLYHVHAGTAIRAADVRTMKLSTAQGTDLQVTLAADGAVMINNARVIKTDVIATNGVIHWIDTVLMPQ